LFFKKAQILGLALLVISGIPKDEGKARFHRLVFSAACHLAKKWVCGIEDNEPKRLARASLQLPGRVITNKSELSYRAAHLLGSFGSHTLRVV
jgi:hypothetical protein